MESAAIPCITQSTPSPPKCFPASSMANSSSQLVFSIPGQGGRFNICTLSLERLFADNPDSAAWQVTLTPLRRFSSATKGSACPGKPSISCVLGKKRLIRSLHVSPHPDCSAPADPSPALQCCFVSVLPKMLPSASQPRLISMAHDWKEQN